MLEYVFGTGKCIKILIDTKNHDFDEKTLEAQLTLLIILEAQKQLVEAYKKHCAARHLITLVRPVPCNGKLDRMY